MDGPEKPKWWDESGDTRRVVAISALVAVVLSGIVLSSDIKDFLFVHPWWQSFIAALPAIALAILAYLELRHSGETNAHRIEANRLRAQANVLQNQIGELTAELDAERNKHLQQIAANTARPVTLAERNAATLRKHLRANVAVVNRTTQRKMYVHAV